MRSVLTLLLAASATAAPKLPHGVAGDIDLGPAGATVARAIAYDRGVVYLSADAPSCSDTVPTVFAVDVSNPLALTLQASGGLGGCKANGLAAADGVLYVASWATLLRTFDLTAASPLTTWGELWFEKTFGGAVVLANRRAFVSHGSETESGFYIVDIGNPAGPAVVSEFTVQERLGGISAVRGSYAWWSRGTFIGVVNVSNEKQPYLLFERDLGHLTGPFFVRGDHAYLAWSDPASPASGGLKVFDISDPTQLVQVGSWEGANGRGIVMLGDLAFLPTVGNGVMTLNVSNPASPVSIAQTDISGEGELSVTAAGRYVFVGTATQTNAHLHALEVFDADPDDEGPTAWKNCSPRQTSWDFHLEGDALPTAAGWTVFEGTEAIASAQDGALRVVDDSTAAGSKLKWARNWNATSSLGATVLVRARCVSADSGARPPNLTIEDGRHVEELVILPDRVRLLNAAIEVALDASVWRTYPITTRDGNLKLYVDEEPTPSLTATMTATTARARVLFGSGGSATRQEIWFDQVAAFAGGDRSPSATVTDPDVAVAADGSDVGGKGTPSGVDGAFAAALWSTNGGRSYRASRWDERYEGEALPAWPVSEGSASSAISAAGVLTVTDASTASGSKVKWERRWRANPAVGATVVARARCASARHLAPGQPLPGGRPERRGPSHPAGAISLVGQAAQVALDGTQWHTYRMALGAGRVEVYVDEAAAPALSGAAGPATLDRVQFGSGSSAATQEISFDFVRFSTLGAFAPGAGPGESEVAVSVSGERVSAVVPLDYSQTENRVRFALRNLNGNLGLSPAYTVRVLGSRPVLADGGTADAGEDGGALSGGQVGGAASSDAGTGASAATDSREPLGEVRGCSCAGFPDVPLAIAALALLGACRLSSRPCPPSSEA